MHVCLITYRSAVELDTLLSTFAEYARVIATVPGLVAKTWLRDGATLGGFYLFTDRATAEAYIDGALMADLAAHPAFTQFCLRQYGVLDDLSLVTGSPQPPALPRRDERTAAPLPPKWTL